MVRLAWIPLVYGACVLNVALSPTLEIGDRAPDWLALTAVAWSLLTPGRWTFLGAALVGLAHDLSVASAFGVGTGCYALLGYCLGQCQMKSLLNRCLLPTMVTAVAVSALMLLMGLAYGLLPGPYQSASVVAARSLAVGVFTSLIGLPIYLAISWIREAGRRP